jgi:adenylate cyclase
MASSRRLAAILAADVVGYARLLGADEEGTHERVQAHLVELIDPNIREHSARVVKNTGDGMLAESPVDREAEIPEDRRIRFRIGINLGDVIVEDDDIFGDGVNVAARLEALAEPGGICISRVVRDQVRDKLPFAFEDLGEQSVKNIARPVRVYALRPEGLAAPPPRGLPATSSRHHWTIISMVAAAAVVVVCLASWFWPVATSLSGAGKPAPQATASATPIKTAPSANPISQPLVAPRLSIVVLPFTNLSNDPDQQYFADGVTEDLTTDLSRLSHMLVISRNSAFTYKDKPVNAKQIGRELGVHYVRSKGASSGRATRSASTRS